MYQWGNATGDPEMYGGYLLDPKSIFSAFKTVAYQQALQWTKYDNGWILPQSYALKG